MTRVSSSSTTPPTPGTTPSTRSTQTSTRVLRTRSSRRLMRRRWLSSTPRSTSTAERPRTWLPITSRKSACCRPTHHEHTGPPPVEGGGPVSCESSGGAGTAPLDPARPQVPLGNGAEPVKAKRDDRDQPGSNEEHRVLLEFQARVDGLSLIH